MEKHIDRESFVAWLESRRDQIVGRPCAWGGVFAEYLRDHGERMAIEIAPGQVCDGPLEARFTLPAWAAELQRALWHEAVTGERRNIQTNLGAERMDARLVVVKGADVLAMLP